VLPVMGGLLPVQRSHSTADVVAGITLAAVSIPVALGQAKIAGVPVVTGPYTLVDRQPVIATRAHTARHRRVTRGPAQ
jgi:MFS superfamily sulfate permease-like transporter